MKDVDVGRGGIDQSVVTRVLPKCFAGGTSSCESPNFDQFPRTIRDSQELVPPGRYRLPTAIRLNLGFYTHYCCRRKKVAGPEGVIRICHWLSVYAGESVTGAQ